MREKEKDTQSEIKKYDRVMVKSTDEKGWVIGSRVMYDDPRKELLIYFSQTDSAWVMANSVRVLPDTPSVKLARAVFRTKRWLRTYMPRIFSFNNIFTVLAFAAFALSIVASIKILFVL